MSMFCFNMKETFSNEISRKVYIIKGFSKNEPELELDNCFVSLYADYFLSNAGGAYNTNEIIILNEPKSCFLNDLFSKQNLDFSIVVYIGHGGEKEDNQVFWLNEKEIIYPGQYMLNCNKQIIILESCRVIADEIITVDLKDKIPQFAEGGIVRYRLTKQQSREIYDSHIKRCDDGVMICFACRKGESAYNYIFSSVLLQCAFNWHLDATRHCAILPMDELMRLLFVDTINTAKREFNVVQVPNSKDNMNFPFGVSKF